MVMFSPVTAKFRKVWVCISTTQFGFVYVMVTIFCVWHRAYVFEFWCYFEHDVLVVDFNCCFGRIFEPAKES